MKVAIKNSFEVSKDNIYIFCCSQEDYKKYNGFGIPLPPLTKKNKRTFIYEQSKIVDAFRLLNQENLAFMSTPFACENLWQSNFFVGLENLFRLKQFLKNKRHIVIFCEDLDWQHLIKEEVENLGGYASIQNKSPLSTFLFNKFRKPIDHIFLCYQGMRHMICVIKPFSLRWKKKIENFDVIFFTTWFHKTVENYLEERKDPFFSIVPCFFKEKGHKTALFCHIENFSALNAHHVNDALPQDIYSYFNILGGVNIVSIFWRIAFNRIFFPKKYKFLKKCIKKDVLRTKWCQSVHALMIAGVVRKFILKNPKIRIVHTYEGNCWEKGITMALQHLTGRDKPKVIGYQHTGFSNFFQKLRAPQFYFPEIILTTGRLTRHLLIKYFHHKKEALFPTISLRSPPFKSYEMKENLPKNFKNVLILLQGSPYDQVFLERASSFLKDKSLNVTVRAHPAMCVKTLKMDKNFLISQKENLYEDLKSSHIVLHNGTTAALEAAYLGVPTVYLDLDFALSNNTLFDLENNLLMHLGSKKNSFSNIVQALTKSTHLFPEHLHTFQEHYNLYFTPPNDSKIEDLRRLVMD